MPVMISAPTVAHVPTPDAPTRSILWLANAVLRHRRLVAGFAVGLAAIAVPLGLLRQRTYTSSTSIMSAQRSPSRGVFSIAEQLGIGAGGLDGGGPTAQFYADLLLSREILSSVVNARYIVHTKHGTLNKSLIEFLKVDDGDSLSREAQAIAALAKRIAVTVSTRTAVIHFTVTLPYPELARDAAVRLVDELNRFNLERRQSQATSERKFTEARLQAVRQELADAEDRLALFSTRNVRIESPTLQLQRDRLAREVAVRQSVYSTLASAYEQARIDEVRDIPVLTIIEHPVLPWRPDSRQIVRLAVMSLLAGALIGIVLAVQIESFTGKLTGDGDPRVEFRLLARQALADVRHPIRAFRGPTAGGTS